MLTNPRNRLLREEKLVFDTSVFIPYYREDAYAQFIERALKKEKAYLPAPVIEELYAGTLNRAEKRQLDVLYNRLDKFGHILVPSAADWAYAGIYLSRYSRRFGRIVPKEHLIDVLCAILAINLGGTFVTENEAHFRQWQRILKAAGKVLKLLIVERAKSERTGGQRN